MRGKILKSVGKYLKTWENIQSCGKTFKNVGKSPGWGRWQSSMVIWCGKTFEFFH